jgi:N-acetylglucosamine-6-sulfatase
MLEKSMLLGFLTGLAVFLASGCSSFDSPQAEVSADQPNIVFILADDLDYASAQKMPALRSLLIERGASFDKAFVSLPQCCPSRATILTGLYAHNHDVTENNPPDGGWGKFVYEGHEENTIATRLQEDGYRTALFGKYLNGYPEDGVEDPTYVPPGWDEWYGKQRGQKLYRYDINENGEVVSYGKKTEDFYTDVLSGQATDFVRRAAPEDRPFFAYVAPTAPHGPATPAERHKGAFADEKVSRPPSFDEEDVSDKPFPFKEAERIPEERASDIDDYYRQRLESMLAVDEMVASLVEELEAAGELDNTFILFTSDNGYQLGEHLIRFKKGYPYEESTRVPLFVRGPGVPNGSKVEDLTLNTDFAPTFADLAGVPFSADGRSLAPLVRGEDLPSWRSAILLEALPRASKSTSSGDGGGGGEESEGDGGGEEEESKGDGGSTRKDRCKKESNPKCRAMGSPRPFLTYKAVRTETHKYVEYETGKKELYDLEADPYELDSIHESADPSLLEDLKTKLNALTSCAAEACREAEDAP